MLRVWDEMKSRDDLLNHVEWWLAKDAPEAARGHRLREDVHQIMLDVYKDRHPEDFGVQVAEATPPQARQTSSYTVPAPPPRKKTSKKRGEAK
jgi:hypothetical protein